MLKKLTAGMLAALTLGSTALVAEELVFPVIDGPFYTVSDYVTFPGEVKLGGEPDYTPSHRVTFHLTSGYDSAKNVILQMRIRSTNKSQYNAVYVNPEFPPPEGDYCDSVHADANEDWRVDFLPYSVHEAWNGHQSWSNVWTTYHKVIPGHLLRLGENEVVICARNPHGDTSHDLDKFYVQDIAIHYYRFLQDQ